MKKNLLLAVTSVAAVSLATAAFAADANRRKNAAGKADTDKDGKISQAEFVASVKDRMDEAKAKAAFAKRDKNGDGFLDGDELKAGGKKNEGDAGGEKKRKKDQ